MANYAKDIPLGLTGTGMHKPFKTTAFRNEMIKERRHIFSTRRYNCTLDKNLKKRIPITCTAIVVATTASSNLLYKSFPRLSF